MENLEELENEIKTKEKELNDSANRMKQYKGYDEQWAQENATYNKITAELADIDLKLSKKIEEKEAELRKTAKLKDEYKKYDPNGGQVAMEESNYLKLVEEINSLKALKAKINKNSIKNSKRKENNSKKSEESKKEKNTENSKKSEESKKEKNSEKPKTKIEELKENLAQKRKELREARPKDGNLTAKQVEKIKGLKREIHKLKKQINEEEEKLNKSAAKDDKHKSNDSQVTSDELQRYKELIDAGYDPESEEMIAFYKEVYEERSRRIRNQQKENNENQNSEKANESQVNYGIIPVENSSKKPVPVNNENKEKQNKTEQNETEQDNKIEKQSSKKLEIVYNGKINKYIINNDAKNPQKAINFKNNKQKIEYIYKEFEKKEIEEIFGSEKAMKKIVKRCDPQLLVILADRNMEYAVEYIDKLTNSKEDAKKELPYKMTYNLKDMKKNNKVNKMSLFQRLRVNSMAKKNKNVAEYIPDNKSKGWLAIPLIGVLLAGGSAIAQNNKDNVQENPSPTIGTSDSKTPENATPENETPEITTTENETPEKTTPVTTQEEVEESVEQVINENSDKYEGDLILGSKVTLPDGVTYTEDSLGNGKNGEIGGVAWRPAGDYTIDRVALYYNGNLIENVGNPGSNIDEIVQKYADQLGVDKSEISQKAHICVGNSHSGATGWINMDEMSIDEIKENISKSYEEIQQENNENQQNNKQLDYEDR